MAHKTPLSDWKCVAGLIIVFGQWAITFYTLIGRA